MYSYLTIDSRSEKRAPMPLYSTATHDGFTQHRLASVTNIHTAYSTCSNI